MKKIVTIVSALALRVCDFFKIGWINNIPPGLLTKDGEPSLAEIKGVIDDFGKAFEEFKAANDARLAEIEKKGSADVVLSEKVDRINTAVGDLDKIKAQIDSLETKSSLVNLGGGGGGAVDPDKAAHAKAFNQYFRKGIDAGLADLEVKAMSADSNPDGGFTVPEEIEAGIDRVLSTFSPIRSIARVQQISSATYKKIVSLGGTTSGWVGEKEVRPVTANSTLAELAFNVQEIYAKPRATQSILDDSAVNIEQWLADEVLTEFAEQEGAAFVAGDGKKRPRGFLAYPAVANASYSHGNIGYIASGAASGFAASDPSDALISLVHALKSGYRRAASWVMNDLTLEVVRKFKNATGDYIWQAGLQAGVPSLLLSHPLVEAVDMPDIAANSLSIAFGDFNRGYLIVDRIGVRVLRNPYINAPYIEFYTTKRVGGGVQKFEAIKVMKFANS